MNILLVVLYSINIVLAIINAILQFKTNKSAMHAWISGSIAWTCALLLVLS